MLFISALSGYSHLHRELWVLRYLNNFKKGDFHMSSFFLGLSSGTACLAFCAPAIMPYFLYKDEGAIKNYIYLMQFFFGRLIGYMIFGLFAWYIGKLVLLSNTYKPVLMGIAYMLIAAIFVYEYFKGKRHCAVKKLSKLKASTGLGALIIGFATGINLCPSFLLIFTEAVNAESLFSSLSVFFLFFCGTTIYFLPLPLIGLIKLNDEFRTISKILIVLLAIYYFYRGLTMMLY